MRRLAIATLVVLAAAGASIAQPARPPTERERAQAHVKQGQEFFRTQQWDNAIEEYQAALELTSEPGLIFNIALALDRAGKPEEALADFKRYLELAPGGMVADEARENVARLTPIVDEIRAARAAEEARAAAEAARLAEEARRVEEARRAQEAREADEAARARRASALAGRARWQRWVAYGIAGAGAISLGVGVKYGLDARAAARFISDHRGGWSDAVLERDALGRSAQTSMIVFTTLGGAAVVGAGVLYLVSRSNRGRAEALRVDVAPTATGGAVTLSGSF